jgi:hypothetical protein
LVNEAAQMVGETMARKLKGASVEKLDSQKEFVDISV